MHAKPRSPLAHAALAAFAALALVACGGAGSTGANAKNPCAGADPCSGGGDPCSGGPCGGSGGAGAADAEATYGPLEVGADYAQWKKVNTEPFKSPTHGKRFVDTWVNDVGYQAYIDEEATVPVGTVVVKESWETDDAGAATDVPGPIFVMEKREAGYDPEHGDWFYALHWEAVPPKWQKAIGAEQVYWRGQSAKVDYCRDCHANLDFADHMGGVPEDKQAW